jgi:hypothetical protein
VNKIGIRHEQDQIRVEQDRPTHEHDQHGREQDQKWSLSLERVGGHRRPSPQFSCRMIDAFEPPRTPTACAFLSGLNTLLAD